MERFWSTSRREFSPRSIFTFVFTVLLTALLWATVMSVVSNAAPGDATWNGESIVLDGKQFTPGPIVRTDDSINLPSGSRYYINSSPVAPGSTGKAFVIYFSPGLDPPTATTANYVEYDLSSDSEFSNPTNRRALGVAPRTEGDLGSTCTVSGIGYIICPFTQFLAEAMDNVFNIVSGFVAVQPIPVTDPDTALYRTWNVMRTIANVAFIIVFLIIIYSQITGLGITNYGLKKLVPRLFIAAILVNVSFYISSIAVDLSNVAGYSLQDVLINIRQDTFGIDDSDYAAGGFNAENGWAQLAAAVLSGGAIAFGSIAVATGGSIGAALYLLIPLIIGLLLTVLFVLLILAARQAIIIVLIVVSPLAFVANLLPNTEKLFDKWKDLFISMLIFFPAFSLVFGGAQLAGGIIIQNPNGNIITVMFGMAVQVAPLIITPLILRLSTGVLGRFAGMLNDPRKGALDRTKNWAGSRAEMLRNKSLANTQGTKNPFRGAAKIMDRSSRYVKKATATYDEAADANALEHDYDKYQRLENTGLSASQRKERTQNNLKAGALREANVVGTDLHSDLVKLEGSKVVLETAQSANAEVLSAYRSGTIDTSTNATLDGYKQQIKEGVKQTAAFKQAEQNNNYIQQKDLATAMQTNSQLLDIAQGRGTERQMVIGRTRAEASAYSNLLKLDKDAQDATINLMGSKARANNVTLSSYTKAIADMDIAGTAHNFSEIEVKAAWQVQVDEGNAALLTQGVRSLNTDQRMLRSVISDNIATSKAKGAFHIQADPDLNLQNYLERYAAGTLTQTKMKKVTRSVELPDGSSKTMTEYHAVLDGNNQPVQEVITSYDQAVQKFDNDMLHGELEMLAGTSAENLKGIKFGQFVAVTDQKRLEKALLTVNMGDAKDRNMIQTIHGMIQGGLNDDSTRNGMSDRVVQARVLDAVLIDKFYPTATPAGLSEQERDLIGGGKLKENASTAFRAIDPNSIASNADTPTEVKADQDMGVSPNAESSKS